MIVCLLLVSNSQVIAPRRDNTRGSLTPTIHTQSCLILIITWCHHFSTATNILLIKSNLKLESRATAVYVALSPCYLGGKYRSRSELYPRSRKWACQFLRETEHVKSNCDRPALSASTLPPVAKMRMPVFAGDWACEIELRQTGAICFPWRQRSWSCGVFKSWISDAHCPFQWKWQVLHNYDISVLQQVGMFFDGIACLMKVWPLFQREFPHVLMTWRSARTRISNVKSQM